MKANVSKSLKAIATTKEVQFPAIPAAALCYCFEKLNVSEFENNFIHKKTVLKIIMV